MTFDCQYHHFHCKMARSKEISVEKRSQIVILNQIGHSHREIVKIIGVSKKGVSTTLHRHSETQSYKDRKRSGQPKNTSKRDERHLAIISKSNRFKTATDIRVEINQSLSSPISLSTVNKVYLAVLLQKNHCCVLQM